jgi:hypothetical protein
MPFWAGYWGSSWGAFWWICPLIGLVMMAAMMFVCLRMMGRTGGVCWMGGHHGSGTGDFEDVRRELHELKDEVRKLRDRG